MWQSKGFTDTIPWRNWGGLCTDDNLDAHPWLLISRPWQNKTLPAILTYNEFTMDIRRNDAIRYCTYCKRYGHATLRWWSRFPSMELGRQKKDAHHHHHHHQQQQYQMEIEAINGREDAEDAELSTQFEGESKRLESEETSKIPRSDWVSGDSFIGGTKV